jgi:hypothetical protein
MPDADSARKPSKYQPLIDWLVAQPADCVSATVTFAEIERLLGHLLPATARMERAWWTYAGPRHPHIRAWRAAGWTVKAFDRWDHQVTFVRTEREA